jgi:hypothetical protein
MGAIQKPGTPIVAHGYFGIEGSYVSAFMTCVPVTAAQVRAMYGAPVPLVSAPPAGEGLVLVSAEIEVVPGTTPFSGGGAVQVVYHGALTNQMSAALPAATVNASGPPSLTAFGSAIDSSAAGVVVPPATGLDLTNLVAPFTSGNGMLYVYLQFLLVQMN